MSRGLLLILWGWMVIWSVLSGRLDLLLRGVFHSLVGASGAVLIAAGLLLVIGHRRRREATRWPWLISAALGCLVLLIPPNPSFSDLASNRPQGLPEPTELAFVLPPEQRSLTEWVRLLRSQPDPQLVDGNPVNISGFVWQAHRALLPGRCHPGGSCSGLARGCRTKSQPMVGDSGPDDGRPAPW